MTTIPGPIELTWRGDERRAGKICVGRVVEIDGQWFACMALDSMAMDGISAHATEAEAKSALETAVKEALRGER
jgi:hypothetical protein